MTAPLWLDLDGAANARDVGARPVTGGGVVRSGRLLRSDSPVGLSDRDVHQLVDVLGLDTVVDLRTGVEVRAEGHGPLADADGVAVHHLSLFPEPEPSPSVAVEPAGAQPEVLPWQDPAGERAQATARRTYLRYLDERPDSVLTALRLITRSHGATLVHCAAGKDRTGVVIALALSAVGVPRDEVVADYVASAERIEAILARLGASTTYAADPALADVDRHRPRAETIEAFLDELDAEDGGALGWLRAHGWTDADQRALIDHLVQR
jgi:protein-tyrosine phosphatase